MNAEWLVRNIAAHWVQAGVVAAGSLSAMRLLNVRAPSYRLFALQLTLLASLLLPVVQPYAVEEQPQQAPAQVTDAAIVHTKFFAAKVAPQPQPPLVDPVQAFLLIVVAGMVLRLSWLTYGVIRLAQFRQHATDVATPTAATALEAEIGVSPRYILQTGHQGPWTFGPFSPTVALPSRFDSLAPEFQRAVICHELLHIKRGDTAVALCEELAVAALWFHPWIWLLRARIRVAREQVVDARVVTLLGNREEYVRCLVDMSGHDLAPHFSQAGAGMLRSRELRARVDAIFEEVHMSRVRVAFAAFSFVMVMITTGLIGVSAMPLRSAALADRAPAIASPPAMAQAAGPMGPNRLDPAISSPINLSFKNASLRGVLAFIEYATSIVFTGYDASFGEGEPVTFDATIDSTAAVEPLLDRLLTPNGLTYTVTGPRTVVIARSPLAEVRQAMAMLERERRQLNAVYPEYPQDALERGIQGTVVVDITVNAAGDVTTAAVASGPQELRASAFRAALGLKYTKGQSTTALKIAFEYTLTATSWGVRIAGNGASNMGPRVLGSPQSGATSTAASLPNEPDASGAYRIGDTLRPPRKLNDVPPIYPPLAQAARVQGVVIMEARIDEQGTVSDVRTLRSIPLLDQAAIDAVKQWQYTPTLLNGVAVPVRMTVTVNFTLRPLARIQVTMPDGSAFIELRADMPTQFVAGFGRFHLIPSRSEGSPDLKVSVVGEDGQTHLGDVVLVPDGPIVQSPTTPSFGMRLVFVR